MPDTNDAYFILQTIVGSHPFAGQSDDAFRERMHAYVTKALQEAKRHTSWTAPNKAYMDATHAYIDYLLDKDGAFWPDFDAFQRRIANFAVSNSLTQLLLKFTTPGVPDVYQGCELHDLSLVDPDNRRPIDYKQRKQLLSAFTAAERTQPATLWQNRLSGETKLWLTHKLLTIRRTQPDFWLTADYIPVSVSGTYRNHILAFSRRQNGIDFVIVVPLHLARLGRETGVADPLSIDWRDTQVLLPENTTWQDQLFGTTGKSTMINELFGKQFPLAFIKLGA